MGAAPAQPHQHRLGSVLDGSVRASAASGVRQAASRRFTRFSHRTTGFLNKKLAGTEGIGEEPPRTTSKAADKHFTGIWRSLLRRRKNFSGLFAC